MSTQTIRKQSHNPGFASAWLEFRLAPSCRLILSNANPPSMASKLLVDIHTHVYLPRYAALLRSRSAVPFIRSSTTRDGTPDERLLILDHEPSGGRPVGPQYWDREEKLKFMDKHGIDVSVVRWGAHSNIYALSSSYHCVAPRILGWISFLQRRPVRSHHN